MVFPITDWPTSVDTNLDRTDGTSVVYAIDFEYQDDQIRTIQSWLGETGKLIGENVAGAGPSGMVSPEADGGVAFTIAAREDFTSGTILSVGDDYDNTYNELFSVEYDGQAYVNGDRILTEASGEFVSLTEKPSLANADVVLIEDSEDSNSKKYAQLGNLFATAGSYLNFGGVYSYTEAATPVEEVIGQNNFNASVVSSGSALKFTAVVTTALTSGGASLKLYDLGPVGSPSAPRLVATVSTSTSGGPQVIQQALTTVASGAGSTELNEADYVYEVTVTSSSTAGDTVYVGAAKIEVV